MKWCFLLCSSQEVLKCILKQEFDIFYLMIIIVWFWFLFIHMLSMDWAINNNMFKQIYFMKKITKFLPNLFIILS